MLAEHTTLGEVMGITLSTAILTLLQWWNAHKVKKLDKKLDVTVEDRNQRLDKQDEVMGSIHKLVNGKSCADKRTICEQAEQIAKLTKKPADKLKAKAARHEWEQCQQAGNHHHNNPKEKQ